MLLLLIAAAAQLAAAEMQLKGDLIAPYGGNAQYNCAVSNSTGVAQVTWQKLSKNNAVQNLASYSERFGVQVNGPFQGKISFGKATLSLSSITLKNVTWEDEGCYICSFNVFPDGSKRKQACLEVQGISEVKTAHRTSSPEHRGLKEVVFSCSATGRPSPTIEWDLSDSSFAISQPETTTMANRDDTFTSSRNISLRVPAGWRGHVDCLLNRGMTGERQEKIPSTFGVGPKDKDPFLTDGGKEPSSLVLPLVICTLISCIMAAAAIITKQRLKGHRNDEAVV